MNRVSGLLLAAGASRRYGGAKLLETLDGLALVRRAALTALDAGLDLIVVTGAEAALMTAQIDDLPLQCVHNAQWAQGMGSSIACGVRALQQRVLPPDAVLIQLADQVLVTATHLRALAAQHLVNPDRIIVADHGSTLGPPCLFPHDCFFALSQLDGDSGARRVIEQHPSRLLRVPMPAAAFDIDTPDDLARVARNE